MAIALDPESPDVGEGIVSQVDSLFLHILILQGTRNAKESPFLAAALDGKRVSEAALLKTRPSHPCDPT